jgi:hypothetical protein
MYVVDHITGAGHAECGGPFVKIVQYKSTVPKIKPTHFENKIWYISFPS